MLQNIDKNYINPLRAASVIFVILVILVIVFDLLVFSGKDNGITAKLGTADIKIDSIKSGSLYVSLPFILENDLAASVSSESFVVKFGGKEISLPDKTFSLSSGETDTFYFPLMFNFSDSLSSQSDSTSIEVSFTAGLLYRTWSGNYSGYMSSTNLIREVLEEVKERLGTDEKMIQGMYTEKGTTVSSLIKIVNSFSFPLEIGFVRKPVLGTGGRKGAKSLSAPDVTVVNSGDTAKIPLSFTIESAREKADPKDPKNFKLDGFLAVKVLNLSDTVKVSIILTEQAK
ncbi:MAG: hypothetical protein IT278_03570 [Ignavibacteriaceae bacterium]|nr:hypothetical protein [Ignavibacteriaceae bacterium]